MRSFLGKVHAKNLSSGVEGAQLVAACSIVPAELEFAKENLKVEQTFTDFDEMLKSDIDAVVIVTTSGLHCAQIAKALDAGKHVFCEKPLGVTVDECKMAETTGIDPEALVQGAIKFAPTSGARLLTATTSKRKLSARKELCGLVPFPTTKAYQTGKILTIEY